jgi:hypothetical protein
METVFLFRRSQSTWKLHLWQSSALITSKCLSSFHTTYSDVISQLDLYDQVAKEWLNPTKFGSQPMCAKINLKL